jgi:Ran GTPase-activating protein (RanGAP) involved in mRNA processing and transport
VEVGRAIGKNTCLAVLNVAWNGFGEEGCRQLCSALALNSTLRELDLSSNRLNDGSLKLLLKAIASNGTIAKLKVGFSSYTIQEVPN